VVRDEGRYADGERKIFVMTDKWNKSENLRVYHVVTVIRSESILPVLPQCSKGRKHPSHYSPPKVWQLCDDMLNARAQWSGKHR